MLRSIHFLLYLMLLKATTRAQGEHFYDVFADTNSFKSRSNEYYVPHTIYFWPISIYVSEWGSVENSHNLFLKCSHFVHRHSFVRFKSTFFYSQHYSIPNVSHGPERRKRSSPGHRQATHLHSFGHKTWRHVARWNQSRELYQARLPERHADMRGCMLSRSKVWRCFYARSRVLFSKLL